MKEVLKKCIPYGVAAAVFIALTLVYCSPVMEGKSLSTGDTKSWEGAYRETQTYAQQTGHFSSWTGSMFGGMPGYQIGGNVLGSNHILKPLDKFTRLGFAGTLAIFIGYFLGFFILLSSFRINRWLALVGSIAITLSSYFIIIIAAGHATKAITLGLMAPVIGGFYLIYKRRYFLGATLIMIYSAIGFMKHPQMSYYICMLIGVMFFAEIYLHIKEKRWKDLGIGTAVFALAMLVGLGTGYTTIQLNKEYASETMRGGHSELVKAKDETNKTAGLDLDYATAWSYGIDETMTLMIPNFMGAANGYDVGEKSKLYETMVDAGVPRQSAAGFCRQAPTYWGDQPFTAGPVYVGAIICFLFILGCCIVKGPYKWALLAATLFSILLSWGYHFMPLTKFFYNYFPMYNKFRAVSSILIVAEITMPLLGFLAIKEIMDKRLSKEAIIKNIYVAAGITGGLCLIFALFGGSMFSFTSRHDAQYASQLPTWVMDAIVAQRASMLKASAWRSLLFILLGAGLLWLFTKERIKLWMFIGGLGVLVLADMWTVDRHYLNKDNFVTPKEDKNYFAMKPYEAEILKDQDPNYRVLNLASNTFNESRTSYYFKSIGGYHAAKLRRYQDMIDYQISSDMQAAYSAIAQAGGNMQYVDPSRFEVLNMLNTKYFILPTQGEPVQIRNPYNFGNAWFVDSLVVVNTPNEEMDALDRINLRNTAVLDAKFASFAEGDVCGVDDARSVIFAAYAPDYVEYDAECSRPGTLVFSEIYYPYGWHAYIDGEPAEHFRANYTLRALNIPAGKHHIRFEFRPDTIKRCEPVSYACIIIIYLTIFAGIAYGLWDWRKKVKLKKAA